MKQEKLLDKVRMTFLKLMNGYAKTTDITKYIVSPLLGDDAAILGCLQMARQVV